MLIVDFKTIKQRVEPFYRGINVQELRKGCSALENVPHFSKQGASPPDGLRST